jgi:histidinol-phosphate phosphatase family protein
MNHIHQAAILCGGLGTRLRPYTDRLPKAMIPVNGRPFLQYLIEQLREQAITQIVLLTGYRGSQIEKYFGDGRRFGVDISYSRGPAEWETGRRIWEARNQLGPRFLLLYSDNFVPFDLGKLQNFHLERARPLSLMLNAKATGNIQVGADGIVRRYDASRSGDKLEYVEIGYMLVERDDVLSLIAPADISFSLVLSQLVERSALAGMICGDRYHSVSDPERWKLAEQYLRIKRILLIDRDGTLNKRPPRAQYISRWQDFQWASGALDGMDALGAAGFSFVLISNQAGIARGMVSADDVDAVNGRLTEELASRGVRLLKTYVCPHHWDAGCSCRKPAPGLLFEASRDHLLRLNRTLYVGDDPRDCQAAYNANCAGIFIGSDDELASLRAPERPVHTARTLIEAAPWIIARFSKWEDELGMDLGESAGHVEAAQHQSGASA